MSDSLVNVLPFAHLDENSFRLATYELSYGPVNYNIDLFETLLFNPLSINQCFACPLRSLYLLEVFHFHLFRNEKPVLHFC